ncbi:MAG TPA: histidine--tRNA ligase [Nitrospiria bacterium]|jgi:histidyl-tRNA synthetase|nr:histidine--tRNA ligase [Nitrospiria bacterium]
MKFQSIRGFKDILPGEIEAVQRLERAARSVFESFGFSEIRIPMLEVTELFARGIGAATDIVEKEMYTFEDRDGKKITLRPEGTAPVVRAYIEHQLSQKAPVAKLYYLGPMFRHERPQAGRFRQFYQVGVEALGTDRPAMDVEVLAMLMAVLQRVGVTEVRLELNSLGDSACRPHYRKTLKAYFKTHLAELCEDCRRRYETNPMRILDCKKEGCRAVAAKAPSPLDHLCADCLAHFQQVKDGLNRLKIPFVVNERLVRGLDYYTRTAFEVTTTKLGAQNAVAAGGRYDGLVEELGGPPTPAIGFAMGVERIATLMERIATPTPDVFFALLGEEALRQLLPAIVRLRGLGVRIEMDYSGGGLKKQMGLSDKLGARYTLIVGENELKSGKAILRNMSDKSQAELPLSELDQSLPELFKKP